VDIVCCTNAPKLAGSGQPSTHPCATSNATPVAFNWVFIPALVCLTTNKGYTPTVLRARAPSATETHKQSPVRGMNSMAGCQPATSRPGRRRASAAQPSLTKNHQTHHVSRQRTRENQIKNPHAPTDNRTNCHQPTVGSTSKRCNTARTHALPLETKLIELGTKCARGSAPFVALCACQHHKHAP
jgi:hypothetical protein